MTPVRKGIGRSREEMSFFKGPGEYKYWDAKSFEAARKAKARQAARSKNPSGVDEVADPAIAYMTVLDSFRGPRRNPDDEDVLIDALADSLQLVVNYGAQQGGEDFWSQGWDTHEDIASLVAYAFWWLMVLAHDEGLDEDEAVKMAIDFSYDACGMDLFDYDLAELSLMYENRSYWTDQFGPTI